MKYVPGPMVGQLSGSQGNTTASHNRNGSYLRNRTIPVNPNTSRQTVVRNDLQEISQLWRTLTDAQQLAWINLGNEITRLDSQGQQYTLSGFQAFNMVNLNLKLLGSATTLIAPALPEISALTSLTPTIDDTPTLSLAYTATPLGATERLAIFASGPVSPGRRFFGQGDFKLITITAAAAASPANILAAYTAIYGGVGLEGQKIAFRAKIITTTGISGDFLQVVGLVAAGP